VKGGNGFIEFVSVWRLGNVAESSTKDTSHFSLSHVSGKTAMVWREDGKRLPGPRSDLHTWSKDFFAQDVHYGDRFVEFGEKGKGWRVGEVDGSHMSIGYKPTGKTAVIYRSDGTIHPGPRTDYNVNSRTPTGLLGQPNKCPGLFQDCWVNGRNT